MLAILRRIRIVAGRDGVLASDSSVDTFGDSLAAACVAQDVAGALVCVSLSREVCARAFGIRLADIPTAVGIARNDSGLGTLTLLCHGPGL